MNQFIRFHKLNKKNKKSEEGGLAHFSNKNRQDCGTFLHENSILHLHLSKDTGPMAHVYYSADHSPAHLAATSNCPVMTCILHCMHLFLFF